jgi:hypothetical protein
VEGLEMKKMLMAAVLAATALTGTAASAATFADFTINTALNGVNVPGAPTTATITGGINYSTFFASPSGGSSAVTNFNVLLANGSNYNVGNYAPFSSGINAVLALTSGQTGTLNFNSNAGGAGSPLFSFDLAGLFTANGQGALPGGGVTLTNQTQIDGTTIFAGSPGVLAVTAAVPEPATWAMMIGGFGMVGGAMRYRRRQPKVSFA